MSKKTKNELLYEMDFGGSEFIRDSEKKTYRINNVALVGEKSKNGYRYLRSALRKAAPMFEDVKVFVNHPNSEEQKTGNRDVRNLAGKFTAARFDEQTAKIKADFIGLPNNNGKLFVDIAEQMPNVAGMSQSALGKFSKRNGEKVVEEITRIFSVDLVASPATNAGMFESKKDNFKENNKMDYSEITLEELRIRRKDLCEMLVSEGIVQGETNRDEEVENLIKERDKAVQEADTLKVKEAMAAKSALVDKLLAESKLPDEAKTDVFREQLKGLKAVDGKKLDEQVNELIEDRLLAINGKKTVKNMGGEKTPVNENNIDESGVDDALKVD